MPDDDGITLIGTSFTVSASEKVSTGQYENYSPHITVEGEIPMEALDEDAREDLKAELLRLHHDLQQVLGRAAGNRNAEPEWESWTFDEPVGNDPEVKSAEDLEAETEAEADGGDQDG